MNSLPLDLEARRHSYSYFGFAPLTRSKKKNSRNIRTKVFFELYLEIDRNFLSPYFLGVPSTEAGGHKCILGVFQSILIFFLGHNIDDRVDDHTGPVDDVAEDVNHWILVAFVKLHHYSNVMQYSLFMWAFLPT